MILDVERFLLAERPQWDELAQMLQRFETNPRQTAGATELERFHYLYQRAISSLARLSSSTGEGELRRSLEALVARAYGEIHQGRERNSKFRFFRWLTGGFPQAFRRHQIAFALSLAITIAGAGFGATAMLVLPEAKQALMPFQQLNEKPRERVKREEAPAGPEKLAGHKGEFAAMLMTHNIQVSLLTMAMGMTWGVGVVTLLFYNGVTVGAVVADYVRDGQLQFLLGWLLPHGVIEIPAILLGGQAGFVLATALVGFGARESRRQRLAAVRPDVASLAGGVAVMLVWAGVMESFISQYHNPVLPYPLKIGLGVVELCLLVVWLGRGGRKP